MKLWGSSADRDGDHRPNSSSSLPRASAEVDAPSEHTRLLPNRIESSNRIESTNYLSPDDPAVRTRGPGAALARPPTNISANPADVTRRAAPYVPR